MGVGWGGVGWWQAGGRQVAREADAATRLDDGAVPCDVGLGGERVEGLPSRQHARDAVEREHRRALLGGGEDRPHGGIQLVDPASADMIGVGLHQPKWFPYTYPMQWGFCCGQMYFASSIRPGWPQQAGSPTLAP